MSISYRNTEDAILIAKTGAKTFYDTYIEKSNPAVLNKYIKESFLAEHQLEKLSDRNTIYLIAEGTVTLPE